MEYKVFKFLRHKTFIPLSVRYIFGGFLFFLGLVIVLLPLPFSVPIGVLLLSIGFLLIVPAKKVRYVVKIRKGIVYLMKNFHKDKTIDRKVRDIKTHVIKILRKRKKVKN